jgi:hypothetical protein
MPPLMTPTSFEAAWRESHKAASSGEAPPKPSEGAFHFEAERLLNVMHALDYGLQPGNTKAGDYAAIERIAA